LGTFCKRCWNDQNKATGGSSWLMGVRFELWDGWKGLGGHHRAHTVLI
jgi:hypothetical protein